MKLKLVIALLCFCYGSVIAQGIIFPNLISNIERPKIGLVLSGGGAKGLAHIGVLKVLKHMALGPITLQVPAWTQLLEDCILSFTVLKILNYCS